MSTELASPQVKDIDGKTPSMNTETRTVVNAVTRDDVHGEEAVATDTPRLKQDARTIDNGSLPSYTSIA
jgi:hypothetical protein